MRGIVENLESILFDVFFDDILKEKEVEEMKYEEMWFEIKHYLEDYIDSHETITEKIHFTKKQLTMIQRLLKNPYAILLNLKHLNPTQQDMISTCISPSDINYIKDIVKPTTIVKENSSEKSYAFFEALGKIAIFFMKLIVFFVLVFPFSISLFLASNSVSRS